MAVPRLSEVHPSEHSLWLPRPDEHQPSMMNTHAAMLSFSSKTRQQWNYTKINFQSLPHFAILKLEYKEAVTSRTLIDEPACLDVSDVFSMLL